MRLIDVSFVELFARGQNTEATQRVLFDPAFRALIRFGSSSKNAELPMTSSALGRVDGIATHEILQGLGQLHQLVLVSDEHGRIVWMSDALGLICGGTEGLIGENVGLLLRSRGPEVEPPVSIEKQLGDLRDELEEHELVSDFRLDLGRRHGSSVSLDVSAFRVDGENGEPLKVAIVHPASAREDDLELRTTVDFLAAVLDASPSGAITFDRSGFITYANPAAGTVLGRNPTELVGQPVAILMPLAADQRRLLWKQLISAVQDEEPLPEHEVEVRRGDGRRAWIAVNASPLHVSGQVTNSGVAYLRDVTAEREERGNREKENTELESYVHTVSHDLRSPLVSLLGFTRLLKQDYAGVFDDTGNHFLDRVEQAGRTMQSLVHDLLELSRIGKSCELPSLVDPRSVLLQIQAELKLRLDDAGVSLAIPSSPPLVYIDRTRLYQVFSNLIGNALHHMGPCEGPQIQVEVEEEESFHRITVRDNGLGVALEAQERIFEVFQTVRRARGDVRSTGMGLAIVKKIAESHGGNSWVESEPGRGAAFHVTLPRPRADRS